MKGIIFTCPNCGSRLTHHRKIEIFTKAEDDEKGVYTVVDMNPAGPVDDNSGITVKMEGNVSGCPGQESTIVITFWCEECSKDSSVTILRHRGETMIFSRGHNPR